MIVEDFLEKIGYRSNKKWVGYGNDLSHELHNNNLTIDFSANVDRLENSQLEAIGRVYSKDEVSVPYTTIRLIDTAKKAIAEAKSS